MWRALWIAVVIVAVGGTTLAWARELGVYVRPKGGENVVERGGEKLQFTMTAEKGADGSVVVKMVIPADSNVRNASYLRLEIVKEGKVLLWSRLDSRKAEDGSLVAGFQMDESLVKDAYVGIAYDANRGARGMHAYLVPVAAYVTEREGKGGGD